MELGDLRKLVQDIQYRRMEPDAVEVKAARHDTPKKTWDSLSAFANRTGGGVILLGLDESRGFAIVGVGDPQKAQSDIANLARDEMEPPVAVEFTVDEIEGKVVMAVEVQETPAAQKPCYYRPKGLRGSGGAYIRAGGTDRPMTDYEIFGYISSRGQPRFDEEIVPEAGIGDLDASLLDIYLGRIREASPRFIPVNSRREEVLTRLHVCKADGPAIHPTLAGLLMFGKYPQEFFPQLMIAFVQYYGVTEEERTPRGERFLDNQRFEGPIPEMVDRAEAYILAAMRKAALIDGLFRRDIPEYPREALREAIANAVAHRDYSPFVRGSYIRILMFADRLEIQSPGGLFGTVTVETIEEDHSTRNARLMRMMEDLRIVENRGSGIRAMIGAMRAANLEPPGFNDRRSSFQVSFHNHTLMNPTAISWLNRFAAHALNDRQRLALVYLRHHDVINNGDYRRLTRVDSVSAGQELRGLVESGLVTQQNVGRWTTYRLNVSTDEAVHPEPETNETKIIAYVRERGGITNRECRELLGINAHGAQYLLTKLSRMGRLKAVGEKKLRRYMLP